MYKKALMPAVLALLPVIVTAQNRNDKFLNPLPESVLLSSDFFTVSELDHVQTAYPLAEAPIYHGTGDTDGDGNPEIYISGWVQQGDLGGESTASATVPMQMYALEAEPEATVILTTSAIFGREDSDGTAFIRVADFNRDGLDDIIVMGHNEAPFIPTPNILYTNTGSGFTAREVGIRVTMHEGSLGDFNNDGYPDIIGAAYFSDLPSENDPMPELNGGTVLFINDTQGGFDSFVMKYTGPVESGDSADVEWVAPGSSADMGNLDSDPETEVVIADHYDSPDSSSFGSPNMLIDNIRFEENYFYGDIVPLPDTYFRTRDEYADNKAVFPHLTHSVQTDLFDFDNDGDEDALLNTFIWVYDKDADEAAGVLEVYRNEGDLAFTEVTEEVVYNFNLGNLASHEMRIMDINGDGFKDLLLVQDAYPTQDAFVTSKGEVFQDIWQSYPGTWANNILVNTGNGKFVSTFWNGFHDLTLQQADIFASYDGEFNIDVIDKRAFPYLTADGILGFISLKEVFPTTVFYFDTRAQGKLYTGPRGENPAEAGVPGFNEYFYLTENPDVVDMIESGAYPDGLSHYLAEGIHEGRDIFAANAVVHGSSGADDIVLREGNETAYGNEGDDTLMGLSGSNTLDGGAGVDTARYNAARDQFEVTITASGFSVTNGDKSIDDILTGIEYISFNGEVFALTATDADNNGTPDTLDPVVVPRKVPGARNIRGQGTSLAPAVEFTLQMTLQGGTVLLERAGSVEDISIKLGITPDASDVGKAADMILVNLGPAGLGMLNDEGQWQSWNGMVSALVPFQAEVVLDSEVALEAFSGQLGVAGDYRIFAGFRIGDTLYFTPQALRLTISP